MIKQWRYMYAHGGVSIWYDGEPPEPKTLRYSPSVVGLQWEHETIPCEEMTPFEVEGDTLKCENKGCDGKHSAFYNTRGLYDPDGYVEVTWTTPTDSEK